MNKMLKSFFYLSALLIIFLFPTNVSAQDIDTTTKIEKKQSSDNQNLIAYNTEKPVLLARRSGGRSGGRSFSRSRSSSRSYGSSRGYSSRSRGGSFIFIGGGRGAGSVIATIVVIIIVLIIIGAIVMALKKGQDGGDDGEDLTTVKLQVALHATAFQFIDDVKNMVSELDLESDEDRKELVDEVVMLLMQNKDYIKYANVEQSKTTRNLDKAEETFDDSIMAERKKFSQETFKKLGSRSVKRSQLAEGNKPEFMEIKEYIVFSLILCYANNKIALTDDYSWEAYETVLQSLSKIPSRNNVATEILWSPDAEDDVLTEDDITTEYPNLKSV